MEGHDSGAHESRATGHGRTTDPSENRLRLTTSATAHCLAGCGVGEVTGVAIGVAIGLSAVATLVLAVTLGFVFGFGLIPLLRAGFSWSWAIRQVLVAEGLSIAIMETAEVLVEVFTPGVMQAGLGSPIFWGGMLLALTAGFIAAWPVNYWLVGKGIRHIH